jgi:hypothetical protein
MNYVLIFLLAAALIVWALFSGWWWLSSGLPAERWRECVQITHDPARCNEFIYPEKVKRWQEWKRR